MAILRVALDVPLPRLFDYAAADASPSDVGRRVAVPFGRRTLVGVIIEVAGESALAPEKLRPAGPILDDMPALPAEWLAVARFASEYYQRPLGEVIHAALPTRLRRPLPLRLAPAAYALTDAGRAAVLPARAKAKRAALDLLAGGPQPASALPPAALRALVRGGLAAPAAVPDPAPRFVEEHALTPAQAAAVGAITTAAPGYQAFLLAGVTGSGKTEVYLHCIARALANHRQALVLVPEINLTPQMRDEFARRFPGARVVTLTSAVAANERAEAWLAAQSGAAQIVLGTRLAVFAPLPALGLVVVDEEQDSSFKQQEGVRYSARDLAVYRAHAAGVPVVLGSATPSLESWTHARSGRYRLLELKERARPGSRLPDVRLVDSRVDPAVEGLSAALTDALAARLARHEQSLVFLNRRGYAPVLACAACGWIGGCTRCAAHLVLHTADRRLRCHHCGLEAAIPRHCPVCGNVDLAPFGRGTQRIEETLAARFPGRPRAPHRQRLDASEGPLGGDARRRPSRRRRHPRRHADPRQGPRLSAGDAGRRPERRRGARRRRLPRARAALRAALPGRRPRRARRSAGRGPRADALPGPPALPGARPPRVRAVRRGARRGAAPGRFPAVRPRGGAARGQRAAPRRARLPRARARGGAGPSATS